ncbi:MAG TPA: hypothetical protein VIC85_05805, partial [Ktedonobacterales bacterium]
MLPTNFLDELLARLKHRWVTNPQYRAAMSGVTGLVVLIAMCACMGIVSLVTNSALAGAGIGSATGGGAPNVNGVFTPPAEPTFPTPLVPTWAAVSSPSIYLVPNSQT